MNELTYPKPDFINIYNRAYRLAAAVFMVSKVMDQNEGLKVRIKDLSLDLVSLSVKLKDTDTQNSKKFIIEIENNSLELMSILDIASVSGMISKMNGDILKEEFNFFLSELSKFSDRFEESKSVSVKNVFAQPLVSTMFEEAKGEQYMRSLPELPLKNGPKNGNSNGGKNHNGLKRKDLRKNMILDFIKGHNNVSIKDIVPNVTGCSEKTIQRELITLINEGKIKKIGERRWSKYSAL